MKHLGIKLNIELKTNLQIQNNQEDPDIADLKKKFGKLFHENKTVKRNKNRHPVKIRRQADTQKGRPIPIHLQPAVGKEIEKLTKNGHFEKATDIDENCVAGPAVITVKKDKTVKIALDSRKLNEITVKRKARIPNMEELISRISRKLLTEKRTRYGYPNLIWITRTVNYRYRRKQWTYAYLK